MQVPETRSEGRSGRRAGSGRLFPVAWALLGLLCGAPVPLLGWLLSDSGPGGYPFAAGVLGGSRVPLVLLLYPFLLGGVFGIVGAGAERVRRRAEGLLEEMDRRARELEEIRQKLGEVGRLKSRFLAEVLHDLKTPLVAVRGYVEEVLQKGRGTLTEAHREALEAAARNVGRLQRLTDELLEFECLEAGGYRPSLSEFDLVPLVREVLEALQPQAEARGIQIHLHVPARLEVRADRDLIGRVLENLFSNALKFSPEGAPVGLEARVGEEDGLVLLTVWDRGPGIPAAAQQHLFTGFWRVEGRPHRGPAGTGLGLAVVKGILDAHGSTVRLVSEEGKGTSVTFTLPLAEPGLGRVRFPEEKP